MGAGARPLRVLYSFPHRIGADRICLTAWQQVAGLARLGARVLLHPGSVRRELPPSVQVRPTLARGRLRIPYRVLGSLRAFEYHDGIVARRLAQLAGKVDIVHCWPLGSLQTLTVAREMGIVSVLERPNANARVAYRLVADECAALGVALPTGHEHAFDAARLAREEQEYALATRLLCPSDFVRDTFLQQGFAAKRLLRHQYGYDDTEFFADPERRPGAGLAVLFAGGCAPRKGLHHALAAWLASPASRSGRLRIAGTFVPGYAERLAGPLAHPSVEVLGQRDDLPALMRASDVLVLPSVEEGSALVTYEARGSGCVLLVSDAAGAIGEDGVELLRHASGDAAALGAHFTALDADRRLLARLRAASLLGAERLTWSAAAETLLAVYAQTVAEQWAPLAADVA